MTKERIKDHFTDEELNAPMRFFQFVAFADKIVVQFDRVEILENEMRAVKSVMFGSETGPISSRIESLDQAIRAIKSELTDVARKADSKGYLKAEVINKLLDTIESVSGDSPI